MTIMDKFSLKGRSGIITGGQQNIGEGISRALVQAGANLAIADLDPVKMEKVAEDLQQYGTKVITVQTDVTNDDQLKNLVDTSVKKFGELNFLFNNAGTTRRHPAEDFPVEDFDLVYRVNLRAVFVLSQLVARQMIKQEKGGSIVATDSLTAFIGGKTICAYTATKGGVHSMIRAFARDWAQYNIRSNGIGPGYYATTINIPIMEDPVRNKEILSRIPLGRWGEPDDLAGAAVFLASDASAYITGRTIYVDGGWLAC